MTMLKVKPATPELKVRNPKSMEFLPAEGAEVEMSTYWARRLRSGDVVKVVEKVAPPAPAKVSETQARRL